MNYPLKLIEWQDAYNGNHAWIDADTIPEEMKLLTIKTIGFEIQRTSTCITLAMSVASNGDLCDLFTIPLAVAVREQTFRSRLK